MRPRMVAALEALLEIEFSAFIDLRQRNPLCEARLEGMTNFPEAFDRFARKILSANLSDAAHLRFQSLARLVALDRDRALEFEGTSSQLIFVGHGATKLVAHASEARDQIVAFHFVGDVFTVPEQDNYSYSVCALRDCDLLTFGANEFLDLAASEAPILRHLLDNTTSSLRRCREKTIALGRKTASERVAVFLLAMGERIGVRKGGSVLLELPMSRRDIAESLGLTIETVSRQLSLLREAGAIATTGRSGIVLRDVGMLKARAGYLRDAA